MRAAFVIQGLAVLTMATATDPAVAQTADPSGDMVVRLRPKSYYVPVGRPVWTELTIENTSDKSITLHVPDTEPDIPAPEMGLPLSHVFSGPSGTGISVITQSNRRWEVPAKHRVATRAPLLLLAPHSSVGTMIDLLKYFPSLRSAGEYRVAWAPYDGKVASRTAIINITALKQAQIITDEGTMTVEFYYEDAPQTVANFIELADSGFYDGKLFHRLVPGYLLQGGCPRGDGTGIRLDGKRIAAEFSDRVHDKGSLSMALTSDDDPDSASCQFFVCNTRQKGWDGRYTVFGHLTGEDSYQTLDRIMSMPTDEQGRPKRAIYMRSVRIVDGPPQPISDFP